MDLKDWICMYYDLSIVRVIDLENKTADLAYKGGRRCAMHVYALRGRIMEPRAPREGQEPLYDQEPKTPRHQAQDTQIPPLMGPGGIKATCL